MATRYWQGDAPAVAEVKSYTPVAANNATYTLTCNGNAISYTADASATVAEITAGLVAAWNASTIPEVAELTAADATTYMTLTNDTAGVPFTVTPSSTAGSLTQATVTAGSGPNYWSVAANWGGTVPTTGDNIVISNSAVSILYDLDQSSVAAGSIQIDASFSGYIGLPYMNTNGYAEYRGTTLKLGNAGGTIRIGQGVGQGSGRLKIQCDTSSGNTVEIYTTGNRAEQNVPSVLLSGGGTSGGSLTVYGGDVGVWSDTGATSTFQTVNVAGGDFQWGNYLNGSCSCPSMKINSGSVNVLAQTVPTAISVLGGTLNLTNPASTVTTLTIDKGSVNYSGTGTVSTLKISGGGSLTFASDSRTRVVTNATVYSGYQLRDPSKSVTWSNGIVHQNCKLSNSLDVGSNFTLTVS